ncbi:hypothetical protein ACFX13_008095 [Malus domestica]
MRGGPAAVSRQLDTTRALALLVTATPLKSPERKASPLLMKQLIPMATALSLKKLLDGLWHNMWSHRCQLHLQEKRLIEMQLQLAAEMRATGRNEIAPGGVAAVAQYAASVNLRDVNKTKLGDVLEDATQKLPADKPVTREDARAVIGAEIRNSPNMATTPGGGAESLAAAARLTRSGNKRMKTISLCTYMHAC